MKILNTKMSWDRECFREFCQWQWDYFCVAQAGTTTV